ncbi:MAG: hypothetical protein HYS73_00550 [Parcubacteria group bacterium]|nr:hypothetical protein [Parcubacteria group bacterium]
MNQALWPSFGSGADTTKTADEDAGASRLLDIGFWHPNFDDCVNYVNVVFVDQDGNPVSEETVCRIDADKKTGTLPRSVRMPSGKITHDILFHGDSATLVIQLNRKKRMTLVDVRRVGGQIVRALEHEKFENALVRFAGVFKGVPGGEKEAFRAFVHGLQTATYALTDFKTEKKERTLKKVVVFMSYGAPDASPYERLRDLVNDIVVAEHKSRRWIDLPAQEGAMTVKEMVKIALRITRPPKEDPALSHPRVIVGEDLKKEGLGLLWNVGKGRTDDPPALITLRYDGAGKGKPVVAFVGKCIVFDTGGENLKSSGGIDGMHADMGGAAMALATFDLVVRRKAKVNLVVTLVAADNSVSGASYHPRSVLRAYNGKTVEVLNTDAEGRLVLADGICFTEKHHKPDYLVTLATLTGAICTALGSEFAGMFPKSDKIASALEQASERSWNKVWRMPLNESAQIELKKSAIADVSNLGGSPGGAISAAKFLMHEFAKTKNAAHLDVAGVAASIGGKSYDATGESCAFSTGWGPALLWEMLHILNNQK